ncbi:MAG: metallophosphoesterase [Lactobacillus sp.]|jgi:predicted phosphodiesterase|nr:metallophosphoesterase [Lactobacillus sp.]
MRIWQRVTQRQITAMAQLDQLSRRGLYSLSLTQTDFPDGHYVLTVQPGPIQVLVPVQLADDVGGTGYYRSYSTQFKRYNSWLDLANHQRVWVQRYLTRWVAPLVDNLAPDSLTLGVITDTHAVTGVNKTYYGSNGWRHVQELNLLADTGLLDLKVHLGDMIDGSQAPAVSKQALAQIIQTLGQGPTPFMAVKGNHDDNDKYDEHHPGPASFSANTYANIVQRPLANQTLLKSQGRLHYFDKGQLRLIFIDTCDVPYALDDKGQKRYDMKKVMALRQQQFEDIIALLTVSQNKTICFMGHADLAQPKGKGAVTYNGTTLQELFQAFNQHAKGRIQTKGRPADFTVNTSFDFRHTGTAKIAAYICGHRHRERAYQLGGVQYIWLNCSALMGKHHALTTKYNRHWDRHQGDVTEFAGYVLNFNAQTQKLLVFGYGAASRIQSFNL